jgi:hypothetical protein
MKIFYSLISVILFLIIGCTSTYKISSFSSKDKFYEDFNNFAKNKNVKVILTNDSSFSVSNGAEIWNDTLYSLGEEIKTGNKQLALSDLKEIKYNSIYYNSASVFLKNGEEYSAKQLKMGKDSIEFTFANEIITFNGITPINKIQKISYNKRWIGLFPGFIMGTMLGIVAGVCTIPSSSSKLGPGQGGGGPDYDSVAWGALSGMIVGSALGWIVGFDYIYQFNPAIKNN